MKSADTSMALLSDYKEKRIMVGVLFLYAPDDMSDVRSIGLAEIPIDKKSSLLRDFIFYTREGDVPSRENVLKGITDILFANISGASRDGLSVTLIDNAQMGLPVHPHEPGGLIDSTNPFMEAGMRAVAGPYEEATGDSLKMVMCELFLTRPAVNGIQLVSSYIVTNKEFSGFDGKIRWLTLDEFRGVIVSGERLVDPGACIAVGEALSLEGIHFDTGIGG